MIREHVLTISTLLALVALSGAAHAGPRITDKDYWPNEVGISSQLTYRQPAPDWYRARAMQPGAPPAQIAAEGARGQYGCRYSYQGGPGVGPKSTAWC
jgi:hypothetical protein